MGGIRALQKFKRFICMPKSLSKEAHANSDKNCGQILPTCAKDQLVQVLSAKLE